MSDDKKEEAGLVIPTEVNVKMDVTKEDLIAIKVSTYEKNLITEQKKTSKTIAELAKELKTTEVALTEQVEKDCDSVLTTVPGIDQIIKGMEILGLKAKATVHAYKAEVLFSDKADPSPWNLNISCNIKEDERYGSGLSFVHDVAVSADVIKLRDQVKDISDNLDKEKKYSFEIKKSLASISTLERQARAQFASHALKSSKEGQAILENITGIDDSFLLPEKTA